ncbi:hypothetical protein P691DRAFT_478003 [Macrolepiota fuliginosa MF-IS2]|uniref:Ricin B lectin domain-containing protein n=1 Tax=Macrolepiota fuliginosa MF-IS2 TaxID=1400762 RepID=A0A9P6BYB3_9AGAR|nr:hypothetical protein P691DRAFT_478003 [Macrolepiota fuliginosa MF-IS2]
MFSLVFPTLAIAFTLLSFVTSTWAQNLLSLGNSYSIRSAADDQLYSRYNGEGSPLLLGAERGDDATWHLDGSGDGFVNILHRESEKYPSTAAGPHRPIIASAGGHPTWWRVTHVGWRQYLISHKVEDDQNGAFDAFWTVREGSNQIWLDPKGGDNDQSQVWEFDQYEP